LVLYFLGYTKEEVNIQKPFKTNKLDWKRVKHLLTDKTFFNLIDAYNHHGPKSAVKCYQMINKLLDQVALVEAESPQEDVDEYNLGLGRVYEWLKHALNSRKNNILLRREKMENRKMLRL